ncbi:DnaJ sub C member 3 [Chamberlinius hualienensis]
MYSSLCLFLLTLDWEIVVTGSSDVNVDNHLSMGIELTAKGQFTDALSHFHTAVDMDPNNYLAHYRRATVYLALGKSKSALQDLITVIKLKPDFTAALLQKGNILLKQGHLDEAHQSFEAVLRKEPNNAEALIHYDEIEPLRRGIDEAFRLMEDRNYHYAIDILTRPIEMCPWDPNLRQLRAECYQELGDPVKAVFDLKAVAKLRGDSTEAHYKLSLLHYELGDADQSLSEIRECLKLDPDNKQCFPHYKKTKKLSAQLQSANEALQAKNYQLCIEKSQAAGLTEPDTEAFQILINTLLCQCQPPNGNVVEGLSSCDEALSRDENPEILCHRAEAHILNEDYDAAIKDFKKASEWEEVSCGREGLPKAQKLQKQSNKRDYYKILGVKRTATKQEVTKAYRKLAQQWHPDGYEGDDKILAEKKFIDIAAAKEVLTDAEKRAKFDAGEDPLDPESAAGQGFNPFAQGFHPFGQGGGGQGGPFQFRFHFN